MFRSARRKRGEADMADRQQFPHLVSVTRIVKLPIVETSWHLATDVYARIKKSNSLVSWGLNTAESSVQVALETTLPAMIVLERPFALIDSLLCKSLDIVEERVPLVTLPPIQIYETTKRYVSKAVVLPVLHRADSVKQFGLSQANSAVLRLDGVINVADKYVDEYLPGATSEENHEANNFVSSSRNNKALQTFHRVDRLSRKLQRRLTQRTVAEVKAFRQYSEDALRFLLFTAELLVKDPKALKEKVVALWAELSKDEPENQQRPANLEQLTVMVTRELARRVVHLINYSQEGISTLPQTISQSLHIAADYCTQLTDIVVKVAHLGEMKEVAFARARIQINKIQALLKEINEYASQLLEHPLFTRHVQRLPLTHFRKRDEMLLNFKKTVQLLQPQIFQLLTKNQRKALSMIQLPPHPPINFRKSSVYLI
ncbi:lipid storage droplets surface-binding protein 1 isoform X2 [Zootermopsis nevadensis]|uniref:Lipid storage droplets surface-binding protein 1 n=2 Tax=Zootermopsis nevadensis TaxID=136037 RepID=A0A067RMQ2_ZOONE|nr:lipid storage droplets surface-binding protein 1 isoform X2 [Zootermopsis nevadensis]XP_021913412.1 lipid storage droplets surface-binding protein 1 isoform X2 [Zootermopsis nevadensis]XP_021913421.1 lipid storage droplets surface-binding protein 1 isoform X2 [Zootermopsis nevadensis]XP_021913430.1 lipid storage droplets surface-binding protein 1 isoform X2 [Zootermopsis nevadensis]XP_021913434.1 lipid storage droplets surface-binding protein 1 isoform X2 [Zootermopsis nevadensis]KDR24318.1